MKEGKYVAKEAATKAGRIYDKVTGVGKYVFDPKEMGQEIGQYALQVGTQNYFNKARETKNADALVDGFLYGMFGETKEGKKVGALVSKEGLESGLLGGLTGGLMQIKGNLREAKALKSNTEKFIDTLDNAPSFQEAFKERLGGANRGIVLQEEQQEETINGNKLNAKDLNTDLMHNYLAPRIKYGRFDMVMDDISSLKSNGLTEEGLASLKEQGSRMSGTHCLSLCSAASLAIFCQRSPLLGLGFSKVRSLITGIKVLTPNSVQGRIISSKPLPLGRATSKVTAIFNSVDSGKKSNKWAFSACNSANQAFP
jgi:hypothetical protein